jgi:hypothetical protein
MIKGIFPAFAGAEPTGPSVDDMAPVALVTIDLIAPVAEKIVRGLEFKLAGRYIESPLSLRTFIVPSDKIHEWDDVFEKTTELQFGPGLKVLRAVPNDNEIIAMYRILIWRTFTIHVAVGRLSH